MMPLQYRDFSREKSPVVVCNEVESDEICSIGFIAAEAASGVFRKCISLINSKRLNSAAPNEETGPYLFRQALNNTRYSRLPSVSFYP
jgi:hypothetical protein